MMVTVREIKLPHPLPACGERSEPGFFLAPQAQQFWGF